ncbi:MAG TPA: hypothetical protein VL283_03705 [Candidatus Baltobacteraceae bacterium]|jgi:hypothetical protein|nr:hypothetical protein [Candidatus Baltobacteraceae bacterium]
MRDVLPIGIAIFIGTAGAAICALQISVWLRRSKAAATLWREFQDAVPAIIGFRYGRSKPIFGEGFHDSYAGEIGGISFRLEVELVPFRAAHAYRLRLEKRVDGGSIVYRRSSSADPAGPDPLARAAAALRRVHAKREGYHLSEAS